MSNSPFGIDRLLTFVKRYLLLQVDNVRLTVTQRLTVLLTAVAYVAVVFFLGIWFMFFAAIAGAHFLGEVLPMGWSYLIVASIYLVLIGACTAFKRQWFLNPIARFLSRLMLDAPSASPSQQTNGTDEKE